MTNGPVLSIRGLTVTFKNPSHPVRAIDDLDLDLFEGESISVMGESGCGKSVMALAAMRLLDNIADVTGSVKYHDREIYDMSANELNGIRGRKISLIPQSPTSSFDPVMKIGKQIDEAVVHSRELDEDAAKKVTLKCLAEVGFDDPDAIYGTYPHRMSGGMCERALIAMAMSTEPDLMIADEPTKGLDALSRKGIIEVLHRAREDSALMVITHDFKVAATSDRTAIMYSGEIVEEGPTSEVLSCPKHRYSAGLIDAQPSRGMVTIPGRHTAASHNGCGCRFMERCNAAQEICREHPRLRKVGNTYVRCHLAGT
jgi:peptide/nickel transport system ATP-binding protein